MGQQLHIFVKLPAIIECVRFDLFLRFFFFKSYNKYQIKYC